MSRAFNIAVASSFEKALPDLFPEFTIVADRTAGGWPAGGRLFGTKWGTIWSWIAVIFSARGANEFAVELAWSRSSEFPEVSMRPSCDLKDERLPEAGVLRLRSPRFRMGWWSIVPEGSTSVKAIDCALAKLDPHKAEKLARPLVTEALELLPSALSELKMKLE